MWLQLLILGLVIGANNFATALALGALGQARRIWHILVVFALFEFTIPLLGLWLGQRASQALADQAGWLGPALLFGLGVWTLLEARQNTRTRERLAERLTSRWGLMLLAAVLSVDNLVIGFGLGLGGVDALRLALVVMCCSVIFTAIGLLIGARVHRSFESVAEIAAGVLLMAVAAADWIDIF